MRGVSIPAWTVLRESSTSSAAPSEDELQSRASPEMVDEIAPSPPIQQRSPAGKKQLSAVGRGALRVARGTFVDGGARTGMQSATTAPRKPSVPPFPRRPLSGSDEEEVLRPKKKKKRRIIDPEKGSAAAGTRVSLNGTLPTVAPPAGQSSSTKGFPSSSRYAFPSGTQESRRNRRVTMDGASVAGPSTQPQPGRRADQGADTQSNAQGPSSSSRKVSAPSVTVSQPSGAAKETPLQRAQGRRRSTDPADVCVNQSNGDGPVAGPSNQRRPPTPKLPRPHEVIEILDSDEEPATPPPPKPKAPPPPPTQTRKIALPRRTKYKAAPVARYREDDNGVIILTSDEDDPAPKKTPIQGMSSGSSNSPGTSKAPAQQSEPPPKPASEVLEEPVPLAPGAGGTLSTPDSPHGSPVTECDAPITEVQDVEMADADVNVPVLLEEPTGTEDPLFPDGQPMDGFAESTAGEPVLAVPAEVDMMLEDPRSAADMLTATQPSAVPTPAANVPAAPRSPVSERIASSPREVPSRPGTSGPQTAPPAQPDTPPREDPPRSPVPPPREENLEAKPQIPSPPPMPSPPPSAPSPPVTCSGTDTPVSAILDAPLKDLAISRNSSDEASAEELPPSASQPAPSTVSNASPNPMQSTPPKFLSQPLPDRRKIRIKGGSLHGGPDGFFSSVYRVVQKRRAGLLSPQADSGALSTSANASPRATATVSPKASRVARKNTPQPSQEGQAPGSALSPQKSVPPALQPESADLAPALAEMPTLSVAPTAANASSSGTWEEIMKESSRQGSGELESIVEREEVSKTTELFEVVAAASKEVTSSLISTASVAPSIHVQLPTATSCAAEPAPEHPDPAPTEQASKTVDRSISEASRRDTPPAEEKPDVRTLSQIIRKAVSEIARKDVIDLTFDDSDSEAPQVDVNKLSSETHGKEGLAHVPPLPSAAHPAAAAGPATPAPAATSQPLRTLDLSAIRNIRRLSRLSQQLSPTKPTTNQMPLPRNMRRASDPNKSPKTDPSSPSPAPCPHAAPSSAPAIPTLPNGAPSSGVTNSEVPVKPKPMLPRLRDLRRAAQLSSLQSPGLQSQDKSPSPVSPADSNEQPLSPRVPSPSGIGSPPFGTNVHGAEPARSSPVVDPGQHVATPSRSSSPEAMEAMEEEECLSLIYPDSAEVTPEFEMTLEPGDEPEQEPPMIGPRTRSQAASETSSLKSAPRRSARLSTTTSASSSVEPPERPASRSRRYEPYVRIPSDDEIVSNGGIARRGRPKFLKAFEDAGFEAISWKKDRKRLAREFAPVTQLAKDIPHDLQDRLNSLSLSARSAGNMQVLIFEAEIRANTAEDEPYAPPIQIVNEIDDEPTPPLEFYYSNLMWHGEGVPKPDHESLRGCDCIGPCDPMSKTCTCVKRQRKYWDGAGGGGGFIYDRKGKLRAHEYPIFECNMNCACSDDCTNRVVQHGRQYEIAICKTPNKGWGVFAGTKKIPANSYVGLYAGEYLTDSETEKRGKIYNKFGRTYLFDLDFWFLKQAGYENAHYCVDAYHAGNFTRYLNHSCDPNCVINACYINEANLEKPLLTIFTCRDVEPYEELCFSYFGTPDDEDADVTTQKIDDAVYVTCQCGASNCRGTMWR